MQCLYSAYVHDIASYFGVSSLFAVHALFKLGSYGDADASRVDVSAVVPDVGVQNNCKEATISNIYYSWCCLQQVCNHTQLETLSTAHALICSCKES